MRPIRWGILGAGRIAHTFARDARLVAQAEVVAIASRRLESARAFAHTHGLPKAMEGYDALLADPDIDAIYVATPHTLHVPWSAAALRAGKAVLCEKPLAVSGEEARGLIEVARQTDGYLMEALWTWFLPAMHQARAWVDAGRIGTLLHIRAELGFLMPFDPASRLYDPQLGGGCLLDVGIYPLAIARWFLRRSPQHVEVVARDAPNGVEDDLSMLLDYGDCTAALAASFRCRLPNVTTLVGTEGFLTLPDGWRATTCHLHRGEALVDVFEEPRRGTGFEHQIAAVCDDVRQGRRASSVVPHEASLAFQDDMDRVRAQMR